MKLYNTLAILFVLAGIALAGCSSTPVPASTPVTQTPPSTLKAPPALSAKPAPLKQVDPHTLDASYDRRKKFFDRFVKAVTLVASSKHLIGQFSDVAKQNADIIAKHSTLVRPYNEDQAMPLNNMGVDRKLFIMPVLSQDKIGDSLKSRMATCIATADSAPGTQMTLNAAMMDACSSNLLIGLVGQHEMVHIRGGNEKDAYTFEFSLLEQIGGEKYSKIVGPLIKKFESSLQTQRPNQLPEYDTRLDGLFGGPPKGPLESKVRMTEVFLHAMVSAMLDFAGKAHANPEDTSKVINEMLTHGLGTGSTP
jgi:hypothetical protein